MIITQITAVIERSYMWLQICPSLSRYVMRPKCIWKLGKNVCYVTSQLISTYAVVLFSFIVSINREGEKWYNLRTVLNKRMLHPKDSVQYGDVINEVVTDFIKRIYYLRQVSPTGDLVSDLANELYRFSLEGIHIQYYERNSSSEMKILS